MNEKFNKTLKELVFSHDNDYGFDVEAVISNHGQIIIPSLSVVIPYFNSKLTALVIKALYKGLLPLKTIYPTWEYEVIIVDDGSMHRAKEEIDVSQYPNLIIITLDKNYGRTIARNIGLNSAKGEKVLFMDADIVVSPKLIENHLKVHAHGSDSKKITVGFFANISCDDKIFLEENLTGKVIKERLNDFRLSCVYQSSWLGCDNDARFVGTQFEIVKETNNFRNWPQNGFFGPWALPNMVLGGFFIVDRKTSLAVSGFDQSFQGYGFTEISLPTKLIAIHDHNVIPVVSDGCLHVEDHSSHQTRKEKDRLFRLRHEYYFSKYLSLTSKEAINL